MTRKPSYAEVKQRVEELEKQAVEREHRETSLKESKELFQKTFESQKDAILILDAEVPPKIIDCNQAAERVFGYGRQEMVGRTTEFLHVNQAALKGFQTRLYSAISEQGFFHLHDFTMRRKDGCAFPTEHTVAPLNNDKGERTGWVSVIRDITERKEMEEAMRESRERYRLLAENVSDVIFIRDMNLRFTYISPSVEKVTGYSVEEAMALTMAESYTPQTINLVMEAFSEELAMEKEVESDRSRVRTIEMEGYRKDGSTIWTEAKMSFLRDSHGHPVGILGVSRDITERKQAERAMIISEERYRSLVEDMPVLVCRFLLDGTLTFVNKSYCDYFCRKREALIGQNFFQFIPEEKRREVMNHFASLTGENPVVTYEHQVIASDGTKRWQQWTDRALFSEAGDLKEYQSLGLDVTDRKLAEEALRESEKRYRQLFNHAPAGIYEVDFLKQRFITVNDVMCEYTGYNEEELLSMAPGDILSDEGKALYGRRVRAMTAGGDVPEAVEYKIMTKGGRDLWVALNTNPVYENGKVKGATAVVHDITERRKVEQAIRQSEERMRSLSAELIKAQEVERKRISRELHDKLGQSLAILKHRVRSIGKSLHSKTPQTETDIGAAVELIDQVIEKVRKISRELNPSLLDDLGLCPALRYLTENIAEECKIPISLDITGIDAFISKEAAGNIYRICQEALTNIVKHAEATRARIKMRKEGEDLCLFIGDDGKGFDMQAIKTRDATQRGLGLAVMEERAYLIGGTLEIASHPGGGGTKILLKIPIDGRAI